MEETLRGETHRGRGLHGCEAKRRRMHTGPHTKGETQKDRLGEQEMTEREEEAQWRPAKLCEAEREPPLQKTKGLGFPTTWGPRTGGGVRAPHGRLRGCSRMRSVLLVWTLHRAQVSALQDKPSSSPQERSAPGQGERLLAFSEALSSGGPRASCLPHLWKPDWRFWRGKLAGVSNFLHDKASF